MTEHRMSPDYEGRDPERVDTIATMFHDLWKFYPGWRFGQLLINVLGPGTRDIFYIEDEELEGKLLRWLEMAYYKGSEDDEKPSV